MDYILNDKFEEFLQYINEENSKIPSSNSTLVFKDNTKMAYYLNNNELRIRNWLNSNDIIKYPIAAKKLALRMKKIDLYREKCQLKALSRLNKHSSKILFK